MTEKSSPASSWSADAKYSGFLSRYSCRRFRTRSHATSASYLGGRGRGLAKASLSRDAVGGSCRDAISGGRRLRYRGFRESGAQRPVFGLCGREESGRDTRFTAVVCTCT